MPYTPAIYDWRTTCAPIDQVFIAGGLSIAGGMTLGGAAVSNPEPGGRAELRLSFVTFPTVEANLDASWTVSRILSGSVMRIRLWETVQLVPWADLDITDEGQTWANGQPWANDENWRASPYAPVSTAAKGSETFTVDLSVTGQILKIGHVIGFFLDGYDFAHVVMDIEPDGDDAIVTVAPPLRRALTSSDRMLFRPAMLVVCQNAAEVAGTFASGRHMQLGAARMVECLV